MLYRIPRRPGRCLPRELRTHRRVRANLLKLPFLPTSCPTAFRRTDDLWPKRVSGEGPPRRRAPQLHFSTPSEKFPGNGKRNDKRNDERNDEHGSGSLVARERQAAV